MVAAALLGCVTVSTLDGARPLPPGASSIAVGASLQGGTNAVTSSLPIPLPQVEGAIRYGVRPDLDVGLRLYVLGAQVDMRYRFAKVGPWDLAIAPAVGGLFLPLPRVQGGWVDFRVPVRAERDLNPQWSWVVGVTPLARETFANTSGETFGDGSTGDLGLMIGGATRLEYHRKQGWLGITVDVLAQPAASVPPAWSLGLDGGLRFAGRDEGKQKKRR